MDQDSLDGAVVRALREYDIDVLTTEETGQRRASDEDQLAYALDEGRVIYTANVRDFKALHDQCLASGRTHAGIILRTWQKTPVSAQIRALRNIVAERSEMDMMNRVEYLNAWL